VDGFRHSGGRELSVEEQARLRRRARTISVRVVGAVLAFWVVLCSALTALVAVEEAQGLARVVAAVVATLLFGGTGVLVLVVRVLWQERRMLDRDAREGRVDRFAGALIAPPETDSPLAALVGTGTLEAETGLPQWFEVLPVSGFVWQANGAYPRCWIQAFSTHSDIAPTPEYAAVAAEWLEPVHGVEGAVEVGQRELSGAEVAELKRHGQRLLRPVWWLAPLNLWLVVVVWLCLQAGEIPRGWNLVTFSLLAAVTMAWNCVVKGDLVRARARFQEARVGRVTIARLEMEDEDEDDDAEETEAEGTEAAEAEPRTSVIEFLPFSGDAWTVDRRPSFWRMLSLL
jgi:hypothetical protein